MATRAILGLTHDAKSLMILQNIARSQIAPAKSKFGSDIPAMGLKKGIGAATAPEGMWRPPEPQQAALPQEDERQPVVHWFNLDYQSAALARG